jgi:hypothetical protein
MLSKTVLMIVALAALVAGTFVSAPLASAQPCALGLNVTYAPVQQLSLADIDFEHFESRNLLFTVVITNPGADATARLRGVLHVQLADGSYSGDALTFVTAQFPVPPGGRQLTNMDLGYKSDIRTEELDFADEAKDNVQDVALSTGKFPAGVYTLSITLAQTNCSAGGDTSVGTKDIVLDLGNPSRVELRSPRDGEQTGEFPLFEFYSDGTPVTLTVAEIAPGQSREDAIDREPAMLVTEINGQNSFLYAGGRPLERGTSYVWQVRSSTVVSGGGNAAVASPVGLFTVAAAPGAEGASTEDAILRQLEELFGSRYPSLFKAIRDGKLVLTGTFTLNQSTLSQAQLLDLVNQLREMSESVDLTLE